MNDNFSTGVKTLLARMKSNPDEFRGYGGKWHELLEGIQAVKNGAVSSSWMPYALTQEEIDAIHEGHKQVRRMEFDEWVMKKILHGGPEEYLDSKLVKPRPPSFTAGIRAEYAEAMAKKLTEEQRRAIMAQGIPIK